MRKGDEKKERGGEGYKSPRNNTIKKDDYYVESLRDNDMIDRVQMESQELQP